MRKVALAAAFALALPAGAAAHLERPARYPDWTKGSVPQYRTSGPSLVVCKPDSAARIEKLPAAARTRNRALLSQCAYADIQAAVNAAASGSRILVLPGVYRELPSRAMPRPDPACAALVVPAAGAPSVLVPSYDYQLRCPNADNLIALTGDTNGDYVCDVHCNLQIEGTGATPADVVVEGDRTRLNVFRADRADGFYLRNLTIQYSDFNDVYVIETNGFRLDRLVTRWSREYGVLSFVSDNGLYERITAYGNGDSGVYPGAGPQGLCERYGIEIRNVDSYGNFLGYSGTGGDSIWVHDSKFHGNTVGISMDSVFPGHPGLPQNCSKFERNQIYSNNLDLYGEKQREECVRRYAERDPRIVCPIQAGPIGTGVMILGGNDNLFRANRLWDNWRRGFMQAWVPAVVRGENDPAKQHDTSNGNRFMANTMGVAPGGKRVPNGLDFWWDEEGARNCWAANKGFRGRAVTSDPKRLPSCPGSETSQAANPKKFAELLACATWHPVNNPRPAGCAWIRKPPRPR